LIVLAVAISLLAAPVAGAIGTAVYDARSRNYADQAHTRRPVTALVTTTRRGVTVIRPHTDTLIVEARWRFGAIEHDESFSTTKQVTVGDQIDIWVNDKGERVKPPSPLQAVTDAVCVAVSLWLVVAAAAAAVVALARRRFDRHHDTEWEREIERLANRRSAD
jgi:hypothetical protein